MPQVKVKQKRCRDCKRVFPISKFYVKERRKFAVRYFSRCKKCYYRWVYHRDKANGYKHHGPRQRGGKARARLQAAVATGRIKKPNRCRSCRKRFTKKNLHGHHEDHRKPYDVKWLCRTCHKIADHA